MLVDVVADGPGQLTLFSVQLLVTRLMFQVRFWFGADDRKMLSVALFTLAPAGIEQDAMSNLTKLRLLRGVVISKNVVSYDWT